MLVDYLRYAAFNGRYRSFFSGGLLEYVDPSATTGQHIRYSPAYLDKMFRFRGHEVIHDLYWNSHSKDVIFERLKDNLGISGGPDDIEVSFPVFDGPPKTFSYKERNPPRLEIVIDIDPDHWTERYTERRAYEDTPIIYRRAGPARAYLRSGERLFGNSYSGWASGTLCGLFCSRDGRRFALTCGHVAPLGSKVSIERRRQLWRVPLWSVESNLGTTLYATTSDPVVNLGGIRTILDASLTLVNRRLNLELLPKTARLATIRPISTILQEEPVKFRGSGRMTYTLGRILAVTVRKTIDLFKDGTMREVGDVLMVGHRHPMYLVQRVSRPGDSGAAVRQDFSSVGPLTELNGWQGMIIGGDEAAAYATHAEHLWAWAAREIGDQDVEVVFEG